jgi:hypothetical protein
MISTLNLLWVMNIWVWKKASKELVLGMPFQRHLNIAQ